jgi:cation diffusion facilitator family transporter
LLHHLAQAFIYSRTLSVALLADLIHNFGDALTAIPLGFVFFFRSLRGERIAGLGVVLAIFVSAMVARVQTIERFVHPRTLSHLWLLAAAGGIGFVGNEVAAQVRLRAGHRLQSRALVADGKHARVDAFVSLGVLASAAVVALGLNIADPVIGLVITLVILRITWESWHTVRNAEIDLETHRRRDRTQAPGRRPGQVLADRDFPPRVSRRSPQWAATAALQLGPLLNHSNGQP